MSFSWNPESLTRRMRMGVSTSMLFCAILLNTLPVIQDFENTLFDLRVRLVSAFDHPVDDIVIIGIDDESLDRMEPAVKRWPWPRFVHGLILQYCSGARVIGIDILFPERQWPLWASDPGDQAFIDEVSARDHVILAANFSDEVVDIRSSEQLERMDVSAAEDRLASLPNLRHALLPFEELLSACFGIGHVNLVRDHDGKVRSHLSIIRFHDRVVPSLALAATARYLGVEIQAIKVEKNRLMIDDRSLLVEPDGSYLFCPSAKPFTMFSAVDVIDSWNAEQEGREPILSRDLFHNKIVLFGLTATGIRDHEIVSLKGPAAGVTITASVIDNMLRGIQFRRPQSFVLFGIMALFAWVPATLWFERPFRLFVIGFGLFVALLTVVGGCMFAGRVMLPMTGPFISLSLSCTALGMLCWGQERSQRKYMESMELAKQQFTDMLVHDLKNTIAPIIMSMTMLSSKNADSSASTPNELDFLSREFPEIVSTSINRLMTQINALLDIRRMQEGRLQLNVVSVSPNELLLRVVDDFWVPVHRADLHIKLIEKVPEFLQLQIDPEVFERIMGNLVWNAVKYAKEGTTIQVGCREVEGGNVRIFVANEGKPIPKNLHESLFSAFMTGESAPHGNKRIPSTGLGLTFCKLATEAHNGVIELRSPRSDSADGVEVGLTFRICT